MSNKSIGTEQVYDARTLGAPRMFVLGLQHMFAVFGATVLVPALTGLDVATTLLFAGLGTLLFHLLTKGKVPAFLGSSFAFIGGYNAVRTIGTNPDGSAIYNNDLLAYACFGVAIAGLMYVILSTLFKVFGVKKVMRYFPPIVTGPIIIAIGLTLSSSAITKRQLQLDLQLSLPTITGNIRALEHDGIIAPGPLTDSTGGRKSQSYRFNPSHRTAIGVTMHRNTLRLCAIDLQGRPIATLSRTLPYANTNAYYQRMGSAINDFAAETEKAHGPVLGVSFAIPGAISADGTVITFNDSTGATGVTIDTIAQSVRYPRQLIREAAAIAMTETLHDTAISDAICLYLNRRPSGALIMNGRLHRGPNLCDGAIEHMTLVPGGKPCHCGRRGCMAAYCSPENLPEDYESIPGFFSVLEQGETHHRERMNDWLDHVALAIANVRCVICADVVIGGEAALYLDHDNIADLQRRVTALSVFGTDHFTLRLSRSDENSGAIGAAMQFTDPYMDALCGWDTGPHPSSPAPTRTKIDTATMGV